MSIRRRRGAEPVPGIACVLFLLCLATPAIAVAVEEGEIAAPAGSAANPGASQQASPSAAFAGAPNPFFLPEGRKLGDTFPFFKDGVCHLFCMWMPTFGHFTSRDLVHWEKRPPTSFGGATGCVVEHEGKYYFFYTGAQNICLATSTDLEHWTQHSENPVLRGDDRMYATGDFRDAFVFFHAGERQWWMLFGTRRADRPAQRGGCVGLAKSQDLLHWQLHTPLWSPDIGPHADCPQVIEHKAHWYLIYLQRQTRYRVADSLDGPWRRPPIRDLGTKFSAAGSRPAFDGRRWISFPFLLDIEGQTDLGQWGYGGPLAVPRQWDFQPDGSITQRPAEEIVAAMTAPTSRESRRPLEGAKSVVGQWELHDGATARSLNASGGTLQLGEWPENFYLEADITIEAEDADFHLLFNASDDLLQGYQLAIRPRLDVADLRPISRWDVDRTLESVPVSIEANHPAKLRVFRHGTMLDVFIGDRATLTHRLYAHRGGRVFLEFRDATGCVANLTVRRLE
jgi:beta-fructofuranosidase